MKMWGYCILGVLWIYSIPVRADSVDIPAEINAKIAAFFDQVKNGQTDPAMQKIIQGSVLGQNPAQIQNLVAQINNSLTLYGPLKSFQYVNSSVVADSLIKITAVGKQAVHPLRWTFVYYRPESEWILIDIEFDDQVDELF